MNLNKSRMTPWIEEMNWEFENEVIRVHKNIEGKIYRERALKLCWVTPFNIQLKYLSVLLDEEITQSQENHLNALGVTVPGTHTELRIVPISTIQNFLLIENLNSWKFGRIHKGMLTQYCIVMLYNTVLEKIALTLGMALILPNNS